MPIRQVEPLGESGPQDDFFAEVPCPLRQEFLVIHLPDPDTPDLLLGTCEGCKSWYLFDTARGVMALLPVEELFHRASGSLSARPVAAQCRELPPRLIGHGRADHLKTEDGLQSSASSGSPQ